MVNWVIISRSKVFLLHIRSREEIDSTVCLSISPAITVVLAVNFQLPMKSHLSRDFQPSTHTLRWEVPQEKRFDREFIVDYSNGGQRGKQTVDLQSMPSLLWISSEEIAF